LENGVLIAIAIGLFSAASLPLGALSSFVWSPTRKTLAALMAFGAGALLAALTIDLVASALSHGHFFILALGSIIGGILFVSLDNIVSNYGGYKRKFSTALHYRNLQNRKLLKDTLSKLGRIDIFKNLNDDDIELLAQSIEGRFFAKGSKIFKHQDPADELYIITKGEVLLSNPNDKSEKKSYLKVGDAFGRAALFTGTPHALEAKALSDVWLSIIPKESLEALSFHSEPYRDALLSWLKSGEIREYLKERHLQDDMMIDSWLEEVEESLKEECILPDVLPIDRNEDDFLAFAKKLQRVPWLEDLEDEDAEALASFLVFKEIKKGEYLFKEGEPAHNLYLIRSGEVVLRDSDDKNIHHNQEKGDCIGSRAFLCGLRHTVSVKASKKTKVWVLRRQDFSKLISRFPNFKLRVIYYLKEPFIREYLEHKHRLNEDKISHWLQRAIKNVKIGKTPPSLLESGVESRKGAGASVAIWLGILLDGVPESLVIGANMIHSGISLSLIAGLFFSNYPEALSSSSGMKDEGYTRWGIFWMWSSIMLLTGIGAGLGHIFMEEAELHWFSFIEGLAAGAMLTMIAQTMLPEAYHKGGSVVGLATLMGFLCTISLKAF